MIYLKSKIKKKQFFYSLAFLSETSTSEGMSFLKSRNLKITFSIATFSSVFPFLKKIERYFFLHFLELIERYERLQFSKLRGV